MDRNEAVQKLATAGRLSIAHAEDLYDSFFEKPVVPQYVADWYEEHKNRLDYDLWEYLVDWDNKSPDRFKEWLNTDYEAIQTLVNMHQFGYEVEEEKRYIVKVKGIAEAYNCLNYNAVQKMYSISKTTELGGVYIIKFTRKELEDAGFGWVFDCPGVEVKEVDDGND